MSIKAICKKTQKGFPLWGMKTEQLAEQVISGGLKTIITCVDSKQIPEGFVGKVYDSRFIGALPESADPCGENGEFHSFVYDGPMFKYSLDVKTGDIVKREQFVFVDLLLQINPGTSY